MNDKQKNIIMGITFFLVVALVSMLSYGQGRWDGMKILCPEPNTITLNHAGVIECYTPPRLEQETQQELIFNLEDYNGLKT